MNEFCDNPGETTVEFSRVNAFLREGGFILLAENKEDPNCGAPLEAWAYHGELNFDTATPMTFGLGVNLIDAIGALDRQLIDQHTPPGSGLKCRPAMLLVNDRELATILAALRFHQAENLQGAGEILDLPTREIATDGGCPETLGFGDVDQLCERINFGDQGSYSRQWRCPDCHRVVNCSYEDLAEIGAPYCTDCEAEMDML